MSSYEGKAIIVIGEKDTMHFRNQKLCAAHFNVRPIKIAKAIHSGESLPDPHTDRKYYFDWEIQEA